MAHIIETLQGIRRGRFVALCSDKLTELVQAVHALDKAGKLTIDLAIKPNSDGQVVVSAKVKVSSPHPDVGDAIFYATEDGELERTDPRQGDIEDHISRAMKGAKD